MNLDQAIAKGYLKGEPLTREREVRVRICAESHKIDIDIMKKLTKANEVTQ